MNLPIVFYSGKTYDSKLMRSIESVLEAGRRSRSDTRQNENADTNFAYFEVNSSILPVSQDGENLNDTLLSDENLAIDCHDQCYDAESKCRIACSGDTGCIFQCTQDRVRQTQGIKTILTRHRTPY